MKAAPSYRRAGRRIIRWLLTVLLAVPFFGQAQDDYIKPLPQAVCEGTRLSVNGQLFQRLSTDVTVLSVVSDQGETADFNGSVNPLTTTIYTLSYTINGQDGTRTATTTVTVWEKPSFRLVGDASGEVCPGTELSYRIENTANVEGDIRWTLSTGEETATGLTFSFIPGNSCTMFVRATNSHCEPTEEKRTFTLIPPPVFNNPHITVNPPAYKTCSACTFGLPDWQSWSPRYTEGEITGGELTWADGSNNEQAIKEGSNTLDCKLKLTLAKTNACITRDTTIDTLVSLAVTGLDCKPYRGNTSYVGVQPCKWTRVYFSNYADSTHIRYGATSFTVSPAWDGLEVKDSVLWNGSKPTPTRFLRTTAPLKGLGSMYLAYTYSADYTVLCPYSLAKPQIPGQHVQISNTITFERLNYSYRYCDRKSAELEIKISSYSPDFKIDTVWFEGAVADSFVIVNRQPKSLFYESIHPIHTSTNPNIDLYRNLKLRVAISSDIDDCHFADTITQTISPSKSALCLPEFTKESYSHGRVDSNYARCTGAEQWVKYTAHMPYQTVDSLKIARSDFIVGATFTAVDSQHTCTFHPYFSSTEQEASGKQTGYIVFHAFYHDNETLESFCDSLRYGIYLKTCPPTADNVLNPSCSSGCLSCPGADLKTTVNFTNPSTDPDKLQIRWLSPPKGRIISEGLSNRQWTSRFELYEPSALDLEITYNEGDSIRTLRPELPVSAFTIDPACAPRFEIHRDSCCVGDSINWYLYMDFHKHQLTGAVWDTLSSEVHPVGTGKEDYTDPAYPYAKRRRLVYQTVVQPPALYPYTLSYTVKATYPLKDTVLTYRDTLKIAAIGNPTIFTQDSLYVCTGDNVDLNPYIDYNVVENIIGLPEDLYLTDVKTDRTVTLTARMKYTCDHGNEIASTIGLIAETSAYLAAPTSTEAVCPLDSLRLEAASNGRLNWMKRRWHEGGGWETTDDTLYLAIPNNRVIFDRVDADSVLYTVVAFTSCLTSPKTATFKAVRLPKPEIELLDLHACYPEYITPKAVLSGLPVTDGTGQWLLQEEAAAPPYAPTYDTLPLAFQALGQNGCWGRSDGNIYSHRPPRFQPASPFCLHAGTEGLLEMRGADAYVWEGNGRTDPNRTARYYLVATHDTTLSVIGTDHATGCSSRDTFDVRLHAPRLTHTTDTFCLHSGAALPFVGDSLCRIEWFFNGATGPVAVGRDSLRWHALETADTGVYTRISYRDYCVDTQTYRLRLYSVPNRRLWGADTLCEYGSLQLFYASDAHSVYGDRTGFAWFAPDGHPLVSPEPADTVVFRRDDLQADDAGRYTLCLTYADCHLLDSLHVTLLPTFLPGLPADTFFCERHQLVLDAFNPDYPDGLYAWQNGLHPFPGADSRLATAVLLTQGGSYTATLTAANGCVGAIAVQVEERPLPVLNLPLDTLACRYEECVFYLPDHYDTYAWYDADHAYAVGSAPQQGFMDSGLIQVIVTHRSCTDSAYSFIDRVFCGSLYFASAFTPNGNRLNDRFGPISMAYPEEIYYELTILDRNSHIVFHSTDPTETWDGTSRGRECPADVYIYQCKASVRRDGRDLSSSGRIVLIR